jgi:phage major head subunit gpT-like protein
MALVTSDFLEGLMTNFQVIFLNAFTEAEKQSLWAQLCLTVQSNSDKESYNWLESVPSISEWLDERQVYGLSARDYSVKNKNYEGTISVDRNTIEDDRYTMIAPRIKQLATRMANHPGKLIFELLDDGASTKTYDGVNFFASTGRKFGDSGSIVNIAAGAYAADSAKILAGIAAAIKLIRSFCDNRGEFLNLEPDTIIYSPAMEIAIRNALLPTTLGAQRPEADILKNRICTPYLTGGATAGHDYIVAACGGALKPVLFQRRKNPEFVALDKPDSEKVFMQRLIHYGVDGRYAAALLEPRCAVQVDCSD